MYWLKPLYRTQYSTYTMPRRRQWTSKANQAQATTVAEAEEMACQRRKLSPIRSQSQNSGPPNTIILIAFSRSDQQSSHDDSSYLSSPESTSCKSTGEQEEGYSSDEDSIPGIKLMNHRSISSPKWSEKCYRDRNIYIKIFRHICDQQTSLDTYITTVYCMSLFEVSPVCVRHN